MTNEGNDGNMTETKSYTDTVAPMPHWGDSDITMEALIRARLADAQLLFEHQHHRMEAAFKFKPGDKSLEAQAANGKMLVSTLGFLFSVVEADLLTEIQRLAPDTADEFAAGHVSKGESGDYYPEMLWEWLEARGIDPEKIREQAKAEIAAETEDHRRAGE